MKKIFSIALSFVLAFSVISLAGCGSSSTASGDPNKKVIKVGASPDPHAKILEVVKPILKKQGYDLKIVEFTDYVQPNTALEDGELDANYFQHVPYLNDFNKKKGTHLTYTVKVHLEPMGLYSKKVKSISDIKNNATIAIPNDATNEARALKLLEKAGLIKLKNVDLATKLDITENKKNLKFQELEAAQLPRTLQDVDAAVINTNYAIPAGFNPLKDALILESKDSPYANILAVKKGNEKMPYIKALSNALNSPEVKKYIEDTYKGSIIPAF